MRSGWNAVAGAEFYDAIFELMQIFRRVSRVDDELCRADDFAKVIGAVVGEDNHAIMLGDFLPEMHRSTSSTLRPSRKRWHERIIVGENSSFVLEQPHDVQAPAIHDSRSRLFCKPRPES